MNKVIVSTREEAQANLRLESTNGPSPDPGDLKIWETVYGHESPEDYAERYKRETARNPTFANLHPINFWALVVDQNGNYVEGAEVTFVWLDFRGQKQGWARGKTGMDGRVKLLNAAGPRLSVYVERDGYVAARGPGGEAYNYSTPSKERFMPDPRTPVRLVLGKPRFTPLLPHNLKYPLIPRTGAILGFDLEHARYTTNGPFFFRYSVGATDSLGQAEVRLQIRLRDGGLIETHDSLPWDAPQSGYYPTLERVYPKGWKGEPQSSETLFYFHLEQPERWGVVRAGLSNPTPVASGYAGLETHFVVTTNRSRQLDHPLDIVTGVRPAESEDSPEAGILR